MRRLLYPPVACTLALALVSTAHAQSIGFKLGASVANHETKDPEVETSSITAFAGGGFVRFGLGRLGVQLEALSITKGSKTDGAPLEIKIEYIEVPLLLHLPLTLGQSFAPYVIAGPSVAFDVGCEEKDEVSARDCGEREKTDFGVSAGGGLGFAVGPGALLVEGRYTWGLKDIDEDPLSEVKNRAALLIVGYELPIGRR